MCEINAIEVFEIYRLHLLRNKVYRLRTNEGFKHRLNLADSEKKKKKTVTKSIKIPLVCCKNKKQISKQYLPKYLNSLRTQQQSMRLFIMFSIILYFNVFIVVLNVQI